MPDQPTLFVNTQPLVEQIAEGALLLRSYLAGKGRVRFAGEYLGGSAESRLFSAVQDLSACAPFRRMVTPGGFTMSVEMTNAGSYGWVSDRGGYRYSPTDPLTGLPWPALPELFLELASDAAAQAGYLDFHPDVCLINRYVPGTRMSLHQDKDERDFTKPIVSFSLGLPATFLFGGLKRTDRPARIRLASGDVVVWGGPSRLFYHGIAPLPKGVHPISGAFRLNLTFRCTR